MDHAGHKFDLIVIDSYVPGGAPPRSILTQGFFRQIKAELKDHGIVLDHFAGSANYADALNADIDATFRSVFSPVNREIIGHYNGWGRDTGDTANILYSFFNTKMPDTIYTDNINRSYYDRETPVY